MAYVRLETVDGNPAGDTIVGAVTDLDTDMTHAFVALNDIDQRILGSSPTVMAEGTVDAITANYTPDITLADGKIVAFIAKGANTTTTPTFTPDGLTTHTITRQGGSALEVGDIPQANVTMRVIYNLANTRWELINPGSDVVGLTYALAAQAAAETAQGLAEDARDDAEADAIQTAADRVQTGLDRIATAADRIQVDADHDQTALDVIQTAADRVQTGLDRIAATSAKDDAVIAKGAAEHAQADAEHAQADAEAAQLAAEAAAALAAGYTGTSTTSLLIEVTSKAFTTQASEQWQAGQWITATSAANMANWMYGQVTSYIGQTLVVDIQRIGGSGTKADWNLALSGVAGTAGTAGTNWHGTYDAGHVYEKNDAVIYLGTSYIWINPTPASGHEPADDAYWDILAEKGIDGAGAGDMILNSVQTVTAAKTFNAGTLKIGENVAVNVTSTKINNADKTARKYAIVFGG